MLDDRTHPYWHMHSVLSGEPNVNALYLSHYRYTPQSLLDERKLFKVTRLQFLTPSFIESLIWQCPATHEVAIHSNVDCVDNKIRHLPMVDMSARTKRALAEVNLLMQQQDVFYRFSWFRSGRSFHGYGQRFIPQEKWVELMGTLLLCNRIGSRPVVDPRWVGHRLIGGYAALRWTMNTGQYLMVPTKL